jgi:hypothetical protein
MNPSRAASGPQDEQPPDKPAGMSIWIEEAEDVTLCPSTQATGGPADSPPLSPPIEGTRNVWIEEEEDLTVRSLPLLTVPQEDRTGPAPPQP